MFAASVIVATVPAAITLMRSSSLRAAAFSASRRAIVALALSSLVLRVQFSEHWQACRQ